jgi:hypothetical protein
MTRRYFEALMGADEGYRRAVDRLLRDAKDGEGYFVVGFITAEKAKWTRTTEKMREAKVAVEVPVSAITAAAGGVVLPLDLGGVGGGPAVKMGNTSEAEWEVEEEEIVAVAYDVVKRQRVFDMKARNFMDSRTEHKGPLKPKQFHLTMSDESGVSEWDEDEEDVDEEESTPDQDWQILHGGELEDLSD